MKETRFLKPLLIFSGIVFIGLFLAGDVFAARTKRVTTYPEDRVIDRDFLVTAGEVVEISGVVNGDVLVAGGEVVVDAVVNGDLLAAGGKVVLTGEVRQDVRIAAGEIVIKGEVGRNLTLLSGSVVFEEESSIGGGAVIAAGDVEIKSEIAGDLIIASENLALKNRVGGNVETFVGTLSVLPGADITGDLVYSSENEAEVSESATVSGRLLRKTAPAMVSIEDIPAFSGLSESLNRLMLRARLISFAAALLVGLIFLRLFPNYMKETADFINRKFWKSMGVGFLGLILTPIAVLILLVTIIGIPLGFILAFSYFISLYFTKIFVSYFLGRRLFGRFTKERKYLTYGLGLLAFYAVTYIWIIGGLISFIALLLGLGAMLLSCRSVYRKASKKGVI